jgi:hypothetical protein
MGGPSLEPIRCSNQSEKENTQVEGYVMEEAGKKITLKSKCDSETCWITSWLMESFGPFL